MLCSAIRGCCGVDRIYNWILFGLFIMDALFFQSEKPLCIFPQNLLLFFLRQPDPAETLNVTLLRLPWAVGRKEDAVCAMLSRDPQKRIVV